MTAEKAGAKGSEAPHLTVDDLKEKALQVRDLAESEVRRIAEEDATRNIAIAAGVVLLALGVAFYLGTRRARPCPPPPLPPY